MLQRLKLLKALSSLDVDHLKYLLDLAIENTKNEATRPDIVVTDEITVIQPSGDGKAEFLPELTEEEVLEEERNERLGWKNFKMPWQKQQ